MSSEVMLVMEVVKHKEPKEWMVMVMMMSWVSLQMLANVRKEMMDEILEWRTLKMVARMEMNLKARTMDDQGKMVVELVVDCKAERLGKVWK